MGERERGTLRKILFSTPQGLRYKLIFTLTILAIPPFVIIVYLLIVRHFHFSASSGDLLLIAFTIIAISSLAVFSIRKIINAIVKVYNGADKVAHGNLNYQVNVQSDDEVGKLANSLNQIATRLQETVKAVENEKDKIETMVESIADGVIMSDEKNNLIIANPVAKGMLGFKKEGKVEENLFSVMGKSELSDLLKEVITKGDKVTIEEINCEKPQKMTLSAHIAPVKDSQGKKIGMVTVLRDITKLKEIDQMKSDFVSIVSHELRTPLSSIKGSISLILEETTGKVNKKQKEFLSIAKKNIDRLTRLVNDLLDISKIEAGKIEIRKKIVDLPKLFKEVVAPFKAQLESKNIFLETSLPKDLPHVYADRERITQVFTNLLSNALKFTQREGKISVEAKGIHSERDYIQVSVTDTGGGIAQEDLEKIFDKFQQLGKPTTERTQGAGLGLSIVKEIIKLHQGEVWAESKEGKGATFYFTLPLGGGNEEKNFNSRR